MLIEAVECMVTVEENPNNWGYHLLPTQREWLRGYSSWNQSEERVLFYGKMMSREVNPEGDDPFEVNEVWIVNDHHGHCCGAVSRTYRDTGGTSSCVDIDCNIAIQQRSYMVIPAIRQGENRHDRRRRS